MPEVGCCSSSASVRVDAVPFERPEEVPDRKNRVCDLFGVLCGINGAEAGVGLGGRWITVSSRYTSSITLTVKEWAKCARVHPPRPVAVPVPPVAALVARDRAPPGARLIACPMVVAVSVLTRPPEPRCRGASRRARSARDPIRSPASPGAP